MNKYLIEIIDLPLLLLTFTFYTGFKIFFMREEVNFEEILFSLFYFTVGWLVAGLTLKFLYKQYNFKKEGFSNTGECPNILLRKNDKFILKNTDLAEIPGVNPVVFNNLDEYVRFTNWQRSQGIDCDILFLEESFDTQGNQVLVQRPDPLDKEGGLPVITGLNLTNNNNRSLLMNANRNIPPFNNDMFPGYDVDNQYIGLVTPLDKMYRDSIDSVTAKSEKTSISNLQYDMEEMPEGTDVTKYTIGNQSGQIILKSNGETPGAKLD